MEPLINEDFRESPTKTGSAKVVPMHFRKGTDLELDGTGVELDGTDLELSPGQEGDSSAECVGVTCVLDQMPNQMKGDKAAEYFPWSWKHIRSNLIPRISDGLKVERHTLFDRGTLTQEGIHLLASYEQCCSSKISIFDGGGQRVGIRQRDEGDVPQSFDAWIQDVLRERRHAAQQIPPIDPSAQDANTHTSGFETPEDSSALVMGGEGFDIDTFIDQQLNQMGGVEESAIAKLEEVEAELVDAAQDFDSLNHSSRQLLTRQIAAQAVQDAAGDERLYNDTYLATRRRIQSRKAQQPGKPRGGNAPGASG